MSKKPKTCGGCEFMQTYKVIDYCVLDTLKVKRKSLCHHKPIQFKRKKERREKMKDKISKLQKALNYITNYHIDTEERFISYAAMMDLLRIILAEENQPEIDRISPLEHLAIAHLRKGDAIKIVGDRLTFPEGYKLPEPEKEPKPQIEVGESHVLANQIMRDLHNRNYGLAELRATVLWEKLIQEKPQKR